jgi:hypothetical protein
MCRWLSPAVGITLARAAPSTAAIHFADSRSRLIVASQCRWRSSSGESEVAVSSAKIRRLVPRRCGTRGRGVHLGCAGAPPRVLPGQLPDQLTDLLRDWRASGGVRVGPFVLDDAQVPGEQGGGRHDPVQPQVSGQQPCQGGDNDPARRRLVLNSQEPCLQLPPGSLGRPAESRASENPPCLSWPLAAMYSYALARVGQLDQAAGRSRSRYASSAPS